MTTIPKLGNMYDNNNISSKLSNLASSIIKLENKIANLDNQINILNSKISNLLEKNHSPFDTAPEEILFKSPSGKQITTSDELDTDSLGYRLYINTYSDLDDTNVVLCDVEDVPSLYRRFEELEKETYGTSLY